MKPFPPHATRDDALAAKEQRSGELVLVVAHPDDESLWFSSILDVADRIIFCYRPPAPSGGGDPEGVVADFPLDNAEFLDVPPFAAYSPWHFRLPVQTKHGVLIWTSALGWYRYRRNANRLRRELKSRIADGSTVVTHNAWGEYGHEEHIQVHRVVMQLATALGLSVWHTNYAGAKCMLLLKRTLFGLPFVAQQTRPVNEGLARHLMDYYLERGIWTWSPSWQWFSDETVFRTGEPPATLPVYAHAPPLNLFQLRY